MGYTIKEMISQEKLEGRIKELGEQISKDYEGKSVHLICILKGSAFFACELAKYITVPVTMDFMQCSSYGADTQSSGVVKLAKDLDETITGKNVIVIEDIIDTGRTLNDVCKLLKIRNPISFKVVTLLDKPSRRQEDFKADVSLFTIPDYFVVGYGLDCGEHYRNLPYIAEYDEGK